MSALRVSAAQLLAAVASNADASPLPPHHQTAIAARSYGRLLLTACEAWFLDSILRLSRLSERQQARLNDIAVKVERGRK